MQVVESTITVPFAVTEYGTIRISGSRVSLDSIIHHYKLGATAEEILAEYEGVTQEDIQACLLFATRSLENTTFMPLAEMA